MKKLFLILVMYVVTTSLFSFKPANEIQEKLVLLKNYKLNIENLKKLNNEFYSEVATQSKVAECKYYCFVSAIVTVVTMAYEVNGNFKVDGSNITITEKQAIQFEEMKILSKI